MPQVAQLGQVNLASLSVPTLLVQIVPPQLLINGVPSNIVGIVGTAQWGPKNVPSIVGGYPGFVPQFGQPQPRKYDGGTHIFTASQQGAQAFRFVRVTDGTDTAASAVVQTNALTVTSKYTGSLGNQQSVTFAAGARANSQKVVVSTPYNTPETFDNITQGVPSFTVTPGTYTAVPTALTIGTPNQADGVQAVASPVLAVTGVPVVVAGGTGHVVGDKLTLSNGVVLTVATVSAGAVATVTVSNPGQITAGAVPTNPVAQLSSTGAGTGSTFTLVWGLGQPLISSYGSGYTAAPTVALVGGTGSGGALVALVSYWPNIAAALNSGQSGLRGPSQMVVASPGTGTATPIAATVTLAGGTDGASPSVIGAYGLPALVGSDVVPRTGMYALRAASVSIGMLADCDDSTTWTTQVAFGISEGIYMVGVGPVSDTILNAASIKASAGVDNFTFKLLFGDWITINDPVTGVQRLVSPQGFICGLMGNQAPNQSTLNKPLYGIVATQKSSTGLQYTQADLQALANAQIDVVANNNEGGNYFGARLGINTSSNAATREDPYTRLTYFLAYTVAKGMGSYVGQLQNVDERRRAKTSLQTLLWNAQALGLFGTANGQGDAFRVVLDDSNNPQSLVALGYQFAYVQVTYFSVIRYFVINLEGGQTVQISASPPSQSGAQQLPGLG